MKLYHFIITRFNLPIFSLSNTHLDENYLLQRINLFIKYCLPSIEQQSCQNFKWLVLFDINTPESVLKKIEDIHRKYNRFIPCFFNIKDYNNEKNAYYKYYQEYTSNLIQNEYDSIEKNKDEYLQRIIIPNFISDCIHKHISKDVEYIITTRIDNDDAFHKDFIKIIQKETIKQTRRNNIPPLLLLDYINGYRYILNERFVSKFSFPNGHFTTLIEPYKKHLQSVLYWNHVLAYKAVPIKHINCKPLYIELIHNSNIINSIKQISLSDFIYALKNFKHEDFGYKGIKLSKSKITTTFIKFLYTYTKNYLAYHLKK